MAGLLKRPKPGEDEDDILRMQAEFIREKNTNNLQASAQVVNLRSNEPKPQKRAHLEVDGPRKPSKFAQSRGLKNAGKKVTFNTNTDTVMGNILEKNTDDTAQTKIPEDDDDKVYFPKVIPSILGNIIEKNTDSAVNLDFKPLPAEGFPVVTKYDPNKKISKQIVKALEMDIDEAPASSSAAVNLPSKSYILTSKDSQTIHSDNVGILCKMSEQEIMEEQQKLLTSLDPKLVEFIQSKRKKISENKQSIPVKSVLENTNETMELEESISGTVQQDTLWENDVLSHPRVDKWLHFDSLEKDKLEWMKGMNQSNKLSPKEPYEARFDFRGYLLPYTIEYTEKTKSLFHHGQDSHRPGYSLTELFELSRSTIMQQRVMALNTIAGILEYYSAGTYKDVIEIPLSKILFVIRFAMDENKVIILEPALKAMRSLLYNRIDEACLDSLIGFEEGTWQPCLENDKSEIAELDSKESDLKDFHLAEIDIIAALLRTDILQRLYYILETMKPNFNCVQYSLQILTRLTRDSVETASKIVQAEHLMNIIVKHFLPVTSINFTFEPNIVYNGKPVLAAIKFLRVLSLQSKEITKILISKYGILKPVSEYISSGVDGTYGLRIQMEAFCILTNSLRYGLGVEAAISLMPVIVTTIYKHVQGTDVFSNSSIISASHAAVVLQYVSTLLGCDLINLDNFKQQSYVLLKDGVQKWTAQLSNSESYTCAHLRLLASAFDCWKVILHNERTPVKFLSESLKMLSHSRGFKEVIKNLVPSSNLLSGIENKDLHLTKNLKSLGGSVIDSAQKILPILNPTSPVPVLTSVYKLLTIVNEKKISYGFLEHVLDYLNRLLVKSPSLSDNWFTRIEVDFLFNVVKLSIQSEIAEAHKDSLYAVASKLCYILRVDKINELQYLFSNIVFNKQWFTAERLMNLVSLSDADGFSKALTSIDEIQLCYSKVVNLNYSHTGPNIVLKMWQEPILPRDWIYLPILSLYGKSQEVDNSPKLSGEHAKKVEALKAAEKESVVRSSLEWILFNELGFPDLLSDIDVTDRLCRIMCVFLCDNSLFLDKNINMLLRKCTQGIFKHKEKLNFDADLTGLHNFQDFYTQFLEQFQSVSYGDSVFASCVLVPLSQRHNVKWRKLVWSEYAGCLRALDCPEELLCYDFSEYLNPKEEDESLIKSYSRALSTNLLRPDTLAYRIAKHHTTASGS